MQVGVIGVVGGGGGGDMASPDGHLANTCRLPRGYLCVYGGGGGHSPWFGYLLENGSWEMWL